MKGWLRPYDCANGFFVDANGRAWEVYAMRDTRNRRIYCRWDIDGCDPGASFTEDDDGIFYEATYEQMESFRMLDPERRPYVSAGRPRGSPSASST
jgi:hypothetical protein